MNISFSAWIIFKASLLLAMLLPGPGVLATIGRSLKLGYRRTLPFIVGAGMGDLTFLWIAILGLTAFVTNNSMLFTALKLIAAGWFLWSAWKILRSINQQTEALNQSNDRDFSSGTVPLFLEGYTLTVSNPKVVFFYGGLLPSLLTVEKMGSGDLVLISILTPLSLFVVLSVYAAGTSTLRERLLKGRGFRILNGLAGAVFLAIGLLLIRKSGLFS